MIFTKYFSSSWDLIPSGFIYVPGGSARPLTIHCRPFQDPKKILGEMVKPGNTVLDVDCGMGF
jgi:hypothetical protein